MLPLALAALALVQGAPLQMPPAQAPALPAATVKPAPAPDTVVATVGGKPITAAEVGPYLWAWKSRDVIREFADHRMIQEAAANRGLSATDAEIQAKYDAQIAAVKTRLKPGQTVDDFLASQGLDAAHLMLTSRSSALLDKIVEADFKPADFVKVDTLAFQAPEGASTEIVAKATKGADAAYASLTAGKPWDDVFKASTQAPLPPVKGDAPAVGGSLGWKSLQAFPEALRAQLAAAKPMGVTKPVKTPNGIQIFRVAARGVDAPVAEMADLRTQYLNASRATVLQKLRETTKVEIK